MINTMSIEQKTTLNLNKNGTNWHYTKQLLKKYISPLYYWFTVIKSETKLNYLNTSNFDFREVRSLAESY